MKLPSREYKWTNMKGLIYHLTTNQKHVRNYVFSRAQKQVMKLTGGLYPAPLKILEVQWYSCTISPCTISYKFSQLYSVFVLYSEVIHEFKFCGRMVNTNFIAKRILHFTYWETWTPWKTLAPLVANIMELWKARLNQLHTWWHLNEVDWDSKFELICIRAKVHNELVSSPDAHMKITRRLSGD